MSTNNKNILQLLQIEPSEESKNYVNHEKQFQLHSLITEQRHPKTWDLSATIQQNTEKGVEQILSVDQDIVRKIQEISKNLESLEQLSKAIENAIVHNKKVYIYGCGATGRLAIQIESAFSRPFWQKVKSNKPIWAKLTKHLRYIDIENSLIGEITGGDRALISSLEGFEDLQVIGKLQLEDHNVQKGDVVIAVTEGGETSSVIGTILAAKDQYGPPTQANNNFARQNLYFIYNNPNEVLMPFDRSRLVLGNDAITKICLFTGPQAIAGSTRMQATTISTFVIGVLLENAIDNILKQYLSREEQVQLGFIQDLSLSERLLSFIPTQQSVLNIKDAISKLTDLESSTYSADKYSTYFAGDALIAVFIDSTERSPTFNLVPIDDINEKSRKSWIQVWTPANSLHSAWQKFLDRQYRGLSADKYELSFSKIPQPYLKEAALRSLTKAGKDQQYLYDFSYAHFNIKNRGPKAGDLGVMVLLSNELKELIIDNSPFQSWLKLFEVQKAKIAVILVILAPLSEDDPAIKAIAALAPSALILQLSIGIQYDPLEIRQQIALKMLLNSHSTAVMAKLGRVVGNTMTYVRPGNLKLIGRATYLIQTHVNDILSKIAWGKGKSIVYAEANAVLFDIIDNTKKEANSTSFVALAIIRILEALKSQYFVSIEDAQIILQSKGLEGYLSTIH